MRTDRRARPPWFRRGSLRRRILGLSALVLVTTTLAGVVAFVVALNLILYSAAEQSARDQAAALVQQIEAHGSAATVVTRSPARGALLQLVEGDEDVVAASDSEAEDALVEELRPDVGRTVTLRVGGVPGDEEPFAVAATGVQDETGRYTLVVAHPLDTATTTVQVTAGLLGGTAVLMVVAVLVLISRVVTRSLAPVEEIRRDVSRIQHTRDAERLRVRGTGDEIDRLAGTMNQMLDRLQASDRSVRQFVSDASHELRSPLATMRTALETSDPAHPADETLLLGETRRMQRLVEDLLTLARADDQGLALRLTEVDLDDLVDGEVKRLRAVSRLTVTARIEAARVQGDELRLAQLLRNLTDNALRHARGAVRVTVTPDDVDAVARLRVDNDGPPVPAERRKEIFGRFARLEQARDRDSGGSGLGLSIVRTIAEAHGGTVTTGQAEDGWCRFEVRLPAAG